MAPMPTARATEARSSPVMVGLASAILAAACSTDSSSRSLSFTLVPERVRYILRSSPSTLPNGTCTALAGGVSQPACSHVAQTMARCWACGAPTT